MPDNVTAASSLEGQLYLANLAPDTRYFDPSQVDPNTAGSDDTSLRTIYAFQVDASSLPTGEYPYTIVFTATMPDGTAYTRTFSAKRRSSTAPRPAATRWATVGPYPGWTRS